MGSFKSLLLLVVPAVIMASDLHDIVIKVQKNEMIESMDYALKAQTTNKELIVANVRPKIKANYMYQYISEDDRGLFDTEHSANIEASAVLFSGFRYSESIKAQESRIDAAKESLEYQKEKFALNAINLYFNMKSIEANIEAAKQKEKQFENELRRLERFYAVGSVTEDKLEQVRAALSMTKYELELLNQNYQEMALSLETLSREKVTTLGEASLEDKVVETDSESYEVSSLKHEIKALSHEAKVKTADYWPTLIIKDTYTVNKFYEADLASAMSIPANTNKIQALASITLFDFSAKSKEREIVEIQSLAKKSEQNFKKRESDLKKRFAELKLKTVKSKIASSQLSLDASTKSFEFMKKKHEANLVDTSIYLDSASQLYSSKALLKASEYEYQIALAEYYFYNNIPLLEMIK